MMMRLLLLFLLASCSPARAPVYYYHKDVALTAPPLKAPCHMAKLIVIDPGHGGEDEGTKSLIKPVQLEKYLNLTTAKFLSGYLKQLGYQTMLTREQDIFIPLLERAHFANDQSPHLFVSVHYNAAQATEAEGIEVYYYNAKDNLPRTKSSKGLADAILNELLVATKAKSRGVKAGNYAVIRETSMPAVLVEGGFLTNTEEMKKIKDPAYLKKVAWGIAKGIDNYLRKNVLGAS